MNTNHEEHNNNKELLKPVHITNNFYYCNHHCPRKTRDDDIYDVSQ